MTSNKFIQYIVVPVIFLMTGILFSCVNDIDTIQKVTYDKDSPDQVMQNFQLHYTDSGYAKIRITASIAEMYSFPKNITQFKDGIKVEFFSEDGDVVSILTALYGEINQDNGMVSVRDSVRLKNLRKQQLLETEELHWNQNDSTIYSYKNVIVTEPDKVAFGKGIRTNQEFTYYEFIQPYGRLKER